MRFSAWVGTKALRLCRALWKSKSGGSIRSVPWKVSGQFFSSCTQPHMWAHILLHLLYMPLYLDLQVESLGSCVKFFPNLSHYRITKVVAGGPRVKGLSPGATFGGAAKGNTVPSKPGAGTGLSPNTDGTTKVQCYQGPSARAAERVSDGQNLAFCRPLNSCYSGSLLWAG